MPVEPALLCVYQVMEAMNRNPTVFVVDDDVAMRNSLKWLIETTGVKVETYASADDFIRSYYPGRAVRIKNNAASIYP